MSPVKKPLRRCPCHVCGRTVAHLDMGGQPGVGHRGSVAHKCPHGKPCRGGDPLHRWGHQGYAPNCKPCSERLKLVCASNPHPPVDGETPEPENIFRTAYKILTFYAGAPDDANTIEGFLAYFLRSRSPNEWRFCGSLGFGGKFWRNDGRYYVTCYREDETPARKKTIALVNAKLATLPYYEPSAVKEAT